MPSIKLVNVSNFILRKVSLDVLDGELMVVLGPSGAGKTTLLNVIAGLVNYEGSVLFDGEPVDDLKPCERGVGFVPQDLALFTHLNVEENIAFGLKMKGVKGDELRRRVREVMELLNIEHLAHRYPLTLSGGEQQRVAIARAVALRPKVLLMDEPFNNLDLSLRRRLRIELKALQKKLGLTTVFVTHDVVEAEELADRVAVLVKGELKCVGPFNYVFFENEDPVVKEVLGSPNILKCTGFKVVHEGLAEVECEGLKLLAPHDEGVVRKIAIPPERIILMNKPNPASKFNTLKGVIEEVLKEGSYYKIRVSIGNVSLLCIKPEDEYDPSLNVGNEVYVKIPIKHVRALCTP